MENIPQMPKPSLGNTTAIECECGGKVFQESFLLRRLSKIVSGREKDTLVTIPIISCSKCLTPLPDSVPAELLEPKV